MKPHLPTPDADALARHFNAMNAPRIQRAEAAASVALAIIIAVLFVWALVVFALPCELGETALCVVPGLAPAIYTRPGLYRRLCDWARAIHLRHLIRQWRTHVQHMEIDLLLAQRDLDALPPMLTQGREHLARLQAELARAEGRQP